MGDEKQIATPIGLRNGLIGTAYDAMKWLRPEEPLTFVEETVEAGGKGGGAVTRKRATTQGLELLLNTLGESVLKERPVRSAELFDGALH
eukprot:7246769-Pyramimonas_sp.AAC.1